MLDMRVLSGKPDATAKARLKEWCGLAPEGSLITLQVPRLDNRALNEAWVRAIDKVGLIVRIMSLDERETQQWLQGALRRFELEMGVCEVEYFLSCVEGNLLAAEQELQKLHILNGPGPVSLESLQQSLGQDAATRRWISPWPCCRAGAVASLAWHGIWRAKATTRLRRTPC